MRLYAYSVYRTGTSTLSCLTPYDKSGCNFAPDFKRGRQGDFIAALEFTAYPTARGREWVSLLRQRRLVRLLV